MAVDILKKGRCAHSGQMIMRVLVMIGSAAFYKPNLTHIFSSTINTWRSACTRRLERANNAAHTRTAHAHTHITHAHAHTQALKIDPAHVNAKKYLGVVMKRLKDQRDLGVDSESPRPVDSPKPEGCTLPSSSFGLPVCSRVCICIWYKLCKRT